MSTSSDFNILKDALVAAVHGPFFPDWEFPTLFGLERSEVEAIAQSLSPAMQTSGRSELALHNAVNNLLGYPHQQAAAWGEWLTVTPAELQAVCSRWQALRGQA